MSNSDKKRGKVKKKICRGKLFSEKLNYGPFQRVFCMAFFFLQFYNDNNKNQRLMVLDSKYSSNIYKY